MSERTFRTVVALVLVGALALAVVVVAVVFLSQPPTPSASESVVTVAPPSPTISLAPTPTPGPVFAAPTVLGVGAIDRNVDSSKTLVLEFSEPSVAAIPDAPGSFQVAVTDAAGDGSTVMFVGTPSVYAPGSLGATATLVAPNVLRISIVASDVFNVEPIRISGLGIRVNSSAATGSLDAKLGAFEGSLASGATTNVLASPGTVIASQ